MIYFLLHDDLVFRRIAKALAAARRQGTFEPIVALTAAIEPEFAAFADRFRLTADERPFVTQLSSARPFDRRLWRHVAGEILLYAAADVPAIQTAPDTLAALVATEEIVTIRQAHAGGRDLDFDGLPYRPGHAGLNDVADVKQLAGGLAAIDPAVWTLSQLECDDPEDELAFAQECFAVLRDVYLLASERGQVVVCEDI